MASFNPAITHSAVDVDRRLSDFGITREQVLAIRDSARAASDDASPLMPANAPGTLAYIHGVEAMREQILDDEWKVDRTLGVEAVINRHLRGPIRLCYQNVDRACDLVMHPLPRSAKGPAMARMCSAPLFEHYGMILETDHHRVPKGELEDPHGEDVSTYFVMVGEDGSVEVSRPIIEGHRYVGFVERIFIDQPNDDDWEENMDNPDLGPVDDFEVEVTLKEGL